MTVLPLLDKRANSILEITHRGEVWSTPRVTRPVTGHYVHFRHESMSEDKASYQIAAIDRG